MPLNNPLSPKILHPYVFNTPSDALNFEKEMNEVNPPGNNPSTVEGLTYEASSAEFLSEEELIDNRNELDVLNKLNNLTNDPKYNFSSTLLPGIYGYIVDADTGENITLSLTPYEIAPRLSDSKMFAVHQSSQGLQTAMTVGNRLQAARVFTNFMQETLPSKGEDNDGITDSRFSSKDNRVGELSRFLSANGDESDKSTFLHIVPDVDATGGKIPINYFRYDKDGIKIEKNGKAFVPVNFNFTSSKYTLTIKEFIIENVSEASRELYSLNKSFDGYTLRFFGQQPQIITFSGLLTNFDDDVIGLDSELTNQILRTEGVADAGQLQDANVRGSQRDAFLAYYKNFLAGTKCRDYSMKLYFYYNHRIIEGYLIEMSMSTSSTNDNAVGFGGNIIVKREYTTFETGFGLASSIKSSLRNLNRGSFGFDITAGNGSEATTIFDDERSYRLNYREFALSESQRLIRQAASNNRDNVSLNSGLTTVRPTDVSTDWLKDTRKFDKTVGSQDMIYLKEWCLSFINGMAGLTVNKPIGLTTSDLKDAAALVVLNYLLDNVDIKFGDLVKWAITKSSNNTFYLFAPNSDLLQNIVDIFNYIYNQYLNIDGSTIVNLRENADRNNIAADVFWSCYDKYFREKSIS